MAFWVITDEKGNFAEQLEAAVHPADPPAAGMAPAYDVKRSQVIEVDALGDPLTQDWSKRKRAWVDDPARVELHALAGIDAERIARASRHTTPPATAYAHARKREEAAAFNALPKSEQEAASAAGFPWLQGEADETGQTLAQVAKAVTKAAAAQDDALRQIDVAAVAAKRAVREAKEGPDKRAAAAAVKWPD